MNLWLCIVKSFLASAPFISFLPTSFADEFTAPSNSVADLTASFTIGQDVQLAWSSSLDIITLVVAHWGGDDVGALLSAAANPGVWTWRIGQNDNINEDELRKGTNYVLILRDPSGNCPSDTGWVDCQLQSRGFKIRSNITTTSTSSTTSSTSPPSFTSSTTSLQPSISSTTDVSALGLSTGAKVGIGVGAGLGGLLVGLGIGVAILCIKRSQRKKVQKQTIQHSPTNTSHAAPEVFQVGVHHQPQQGGYANMYKPPPLITPQEPRELPAESYTAPTSYEMDVGSPQQTS